MHGFALQRRLQNTGITVSSLHPGYVSPNLSMIITYYINILIG